MAVLKYKDPDTGEVVVVGGGTNGYSREEIDEKIDELKTSVSEGKSLIAAAVTDKGVETAASDTFATMASNIESIIVGKPSNSVEVDVVVPYIDTPDTINKGDFVFSSGKPALTELPSNVYDDMKYMLPLTNNRYLFICSAGGSGSDYDKLGFICKYENGKMNFVTTVTFTNSVGNIIKVPNLEDTFIYTTSSYLYAVKISESNTLMETQITNVTLSSYSGLHVTYDNKFILFTSSYAFYNPTYYVFTYSNGSTVDISLSGTLEVTGNGFDWVSNGSIDYAINTIQSGNNKVDIISIIFCYSSDEGYLCYARVKYTGDAVTLVGKEASTSLFGYSAGGEIWANNLVLYFGNKILLRQGISGIANDPTDIKLLTINYDGSYTVSTFATSDKYEYLQFGSVEVVGYDEYRRATNTMMCRNNVGNTVAIPVFYINGDTVTITEYDNFFPDEYSDIFPQSGATMLHPVQFKNTNAFVVCIKDIWSELEEAEVPRLLFAPFGENRNKMFAISNDIGEGIIGIAKNDSVDGRVTIFTSPDMEII